MLAVIMTGMRQWSLGGISGTAFSWQISLVVVVGGGTQSSSTWKTFWSWGTRPFAMSINEARSS